MAGRGFALSRDLKVARPFSHVSRVRTLRASTPNAQVQGCHRERSINCHYERSINCHRERSVAI